MNFKNLLRKAGGAAVILSSVLATTEVKAQLAPLGAMYFQNQYLANPAMAGLQKGLHMDLAYRQQWSSMPGSPTTQSVTLDYGSNKKAGLGINILNDEAGLLQRTRVMGTYAYHLPLSNEDQKLSFGVSFGVMNERVKQEEIDGDMNDGSVGKFNQRESYLDGDFGAAYTSGRLSVQAAIPNLKSVFGSDEAEQSNLADKSSYFASASYRLSFPKAVDGMDIEPKVCYRAVDGHDDIVDIGTNVTFARNIVNVQALYHSSESMTVGLGVKYKQFAQINGMYTSGTSALRGYTNGNFELNLKLNLSK